VIGLKLENLVGWMSFCEIVGDYSQWMIGILRSKCMREIVDVPGGIGIQIKVNLLKCYKFMKIFVKV